MGHVERRGRWARRGIASRENMAAGRDPPLPPMTIGWLLTKSIASEDSALPLQSGVARIEVRSLHVRRSDLCYSQAWPTKTSHTLLALFPLADDGGAPGRALGDACSRWQGCCHPVCKRNEEERRGEHLSPTRSIGFVLRPEWTMEF